METPQNDMVLSRITRDLGICVLLAAIFAFLGVYDSDALPVASRFLFWFVLMSAGALSVSMAEPLVMKRWMPGRPVALQVVVISTLVAIPLTIGLVGLNTNLRWSYSLSNWGLQFLAVATIALVIVTGRTVIGAMTSSPANPHPAPVPPDRAQAFLQRLPIKFRDARLWAVSSEGHYLRVHTDKGETMILLRLSDALRDLADVDGLQTHRSWWVAREGVEAIIATKGKKTVRLKSGQQVPVSRSRSSEMKKRGWE
ncbi:LytTR family DNA-binding domain-containing protein [Algimonas porphyrae]|uniref:HTH LytTR-type domain-containing protein n=1 Tax=Algimonas porphyrae TaxID=1128113 RepID=A0ABQ5V2M1_9PROT|nr:LytTR family DNA-binding domain-containing protein [Algimonas porphyrae]GLQ21736.1 hypothetical protein GCM10007854_26910 [Algimonas porphyrae]